MLELRMLPAREGDALWISWDAGGKRHKMIVDMVEFGSPAEQAGIDFDWEITTVSLPAVRPMKEWVFIPTLLILGGLGWNQRRRAKSLGHIK